MPTVCWQSNRELLISNILTDTIGSKTRVLCIDDNPDIADSEALLLALTGFDTRSCYSGRDALTLAELFCPTVCLIDINMPGMDGDELAARLREVAEGRSLFLIAVTARTTDVSEEWTTGFDEYLFKPVKPERLLAAIAIADRLLSSIYS